MCVCVPSTKALMMTPEIVVPRINRSRTYTGKFGAKAPATPNTVCSARERSRAFLLPILQREGEGDREGEREGRETVSIYQNV